MRKKKIFQAFALTLLLCTCLAQNIFQSCESSVLDIAFVIDASPSVDDVEWAQSKEFITKLIPLVNSSSSRGSIYQYNEYCNLELELTNDWLNVNQTLNSFARNGSSGTYTGNALNYVGGMLLKNQRPEALQMIFLLTDGDPNDSASNIAEELKKKGIVIVVVAVDQGKNSNILEAVASSTLFFPQVAYNQLTSEFSTKVSSSICFKVDEFLASDKTTFDSLSSREIFLRGSGFFEETICKFTSISDPRIIFEFTLLSFNVSLGSCQIPSKPDTYGINLHSKYWKNDTKDKLSIKVSSSHIEPLLNLSKICQGSYVDLKILDSKLQNNWLFRAEERLSSDWPEQGCIKNSECPFENYCFDCTLCIGGASECPGCPSKKGGSCRHIRDCFSRKDAIEGCPKVENPCACASQRFPFTDTVYLDKQFLGCMSSNQCYLQDSKNCLLPNYTINNEKTFILRRCQSQLYEERLPLCLWSDLTALENTRLDESRENFVLYDNQIYYNPRDSNLRFEKIINKNLDYNRCYQICITTRECSAFEIPSDESYCGLWLNGRLRLGREQWGYFKGKTLVLTTKKNPIAYLSAIFVNEATIRCPVPSRYALKASTFKVQLVEDSQKDSGELKILGNVSSAFQLSVCSNCSDTFAENFDITSAAKSGQTEECLYQDSSLTEKKTVDGDPEYLYSTKTGVSILDFFSNYEKYDCRGLENQDFITLTDPLMNKKKCAGICYNRKGCYGIEIAYNDASKCYLWVANKVCTPRSMSYNTNFGIYLLEETAWKSLGSTTNSIMNFYLYVHKLSFTKGDSNSSIRIYLREKNSNLTMKLFDSDLQLKANDINEVNLNRVKFISKGSPTQEASKIKGDERILHALDEFKPLNYKGDEFKFEIGVQISLAQNDSIELSGITLIITDWAQTSPFSKSILPSRFVLSCSLLDEIISPRFNKPAKRSTILLRKTKSESLPTYKNGDIFNTFGCFVLYGTSWELPMPALIDKVEVINSSDTKLTLLHEVLLTDIYTFAKIDTASQRVFSLAEALEYYEGIPLNSSLKKKQGPWYIEANTTDIFDNENYFSYRQGSDVIPRLKFVIKNSTLIKGTFELEARFYSQISAGLDTRNSTINITNQTVVEHFVRKERRLGWEWKSKKAYDMVTGKPSKEISIFEGSAPITSILSLGASASVNFKGSVDRNLLGSRGSVASITRMIYNIPKGLATGNIEKSTMDFLPGEAGQLSDSSIEFSTSQELAVNLVVIQGGFRNKFGAKSEILRSSDDCGGSSQASQSVSQDFELFINIPYVGEYTKTIDKCERTLSSVCASTGSGSRRVLQSLPSKRLLGQKLGSCRIINALSGFLQYLDCFKGGKPNAAVGMPTGATPDWTINSSPIYWKPCKDCIFNVPPGQSVSVKTGDLSWDIEWSSLQVTVSDIDDDFLTDNDEEASDFTALAFGEPHILTFSGESILANEVGDFHLIKLAPPMISSDDCKAKEILNDLEYALAKELESFKKISTEVIGAQIRFLPGAWAPDMTMSVALAIKIADETIEVHQLLNAPDYDVKILVNGLEYEETTVLSNFKIKKLAQTVFMGNGAYVITSKYFTIKWSPFSVSVSLSKFVTDTGSNGNSCAVRSEGIVGSWDTQSLRYRFGNQIDTFPLDETQIKRFVNSWRVLTNESIISDWVPLYSDNTTNFSAPRNSSDLKAAEEKCLAVFNMSLGKQLKMLERNCWNKKLLKLKVMKEALIKGCAYDLSVIQDASILTTYAAQFETLKLKEPIFCLSPKLVLSQKEINTTTNGLHLRVFNSSLPQALLDLDKSIEFDMLITYNSSSTLNLNSSLFRQNGSIHIQSSKKGSFFLNISAVYKGNETNLKTFENVTGAYPGITVANLVVNFMDNNGSASSVINFYHSITLVGLFILSILI